jgi:hypothetical protein
MFYCGFDTLIIFVFVVGFCKLLTATSKICSGSLHSCVILFCVVIVLNFCNGRIFGWSPSKVLQYGSSTVWGVKSMSFHCP